MPILLAEVSDKMPEAGPLWLIGLTAGAVAFALCRLRKPLAVALLPAAFLWSLLYVGSVLANDPIQAAWVEEMGALYPWNCAAAGTTPLLAIVAAVALPVRNRKRDWRNGYCRNCGYDLRASKDRCPECGRPIAPTADSRTGGE